MTWKVSDTEWMGFGLSYGCLSNPGLVRHWFPQVFCLHILRKARVQQGSLWPFKQFNILLLSINLINDFKASNSFFLADFSCILAIIISSQSPTRFHCYWYRAWQHKNTALWSSCILSLTWLILFFENKGIFFILQEFQRETFWTSSL